MYIQKQKSLKDLIENEKKDVLLRRIGKNKTAVFKSSNIEGQWEVFSIDPASDNPLTFKASFASLGDAIKKFQHDVNGNYSRDGFTITEISSEKSIFVYNNDLKDNIDQIALINGYDLTHTATDFEAGICVSVAEKRKPNYIFDIEPHTLSIMDQMCDESLYPESFDAWETVKANLKESRPALKS